MVWIGELEKCWKSNVAEGVSPFCRNRLCFGVSVCVWWMRRPFYSYHHHPWHGTACVFPYACASVSAPASIWNLPWKSWLFFSYIFLRRNFRLNGWQPAHTQKTMGTKCNRHTHGGKQNQGGCSLSFVNMNVICILTNVVDTQYTCTVDACTHGVCRLQTAEPHHQMAMINMNNNDFIQWEGSNIDCQFGNYMPECHWLWCGQGQPGRQNRWNMKRILIFIHRPSLGSERFVRFLEFVRNCSGFAECHSRYWYIMMGSLCVFIQLACNGHHRSNTQMFYACCGFRGSCSLSFSLTIGQNSNEYVEKPMHNQNTISKNLSKNFDWLFLWCIYLSQKVSAHQGQ